jgi:uncharacterized protein (TIGR03067 family)
MRDFLRSRREPFRRRRRNGIVRVKFTKEVVMRTFAFLSVIAVVVFLILGGAQAGDEVLMKKELEALRGNWNAVIKGAGGNDQDLLHQFSMVENSLQIRMGGNSADFKFTVNPRKKPKEINITRMLPDGSDASMLGIYELDGDTLKLCFDEFGKKRPIEFKAQSGSKQSNFVLKREKQKGK